MLFGCPPTRTQPASASPSGPTALPLPPPIGAVINVRTFSPNLVQLRRAFQRRFVRRCLLRMRGSSSSRGGSAFPRTWLTTSRARPTATPPLRPRARAELTELLAERRDRAALSTPDPSSWVGTTFAATVIDGAVACAAHRPERGRKLHPRGALARLRSRGPAVRRRRRASARAEAAATPGFFRMTWCGATVVAHTPQSSQLGWQRRAQAGPCARVKRPSSACSGGVDTPCPPSSSATARFPSLRLVRRWRLQPRRRSLYLLLLLKAGARWAPRRRRRRRRRQHRRGRRAGFLPRQTMRSGRPRRPRSGCRLCGHAWRSERPPAAPRRRSPCSTTWGAAASPRAATPAAAAGLTSRPRRAAERAIRRPTTPSLLGARA